MIASVLDRVGGRCAVFGGAEGIDAEAVLAHAFDDEVGQRLVIFDQEDAHHQTFEWGTGRRGMVAPCAASAVSRRPRGRAGAAMRSKLSRLNYLKPET